MDQLELSMIKLKKMQDELMPYPEWAKAEKAQYCFALQEIWHISRKAPNFEILRKLRKSERSALAHL